MQLREVDPDDDAASGAWSDVVDAVQRADAPVDPAWLDALEAQRRPYTEGCEVAGTTSVWRRSL